MNDGLPNPPNDVNAPAPEPGAGKPWYQSRSILGALAVIVAQVLRKFGVQVDVTDPAIVDLVTTLATLAGALVAIWGRAKARQPIAPVASVGGAK